MWKLLIKSISCKISLQDGVKEDAIKEFQYMPKEYNDNISLLNTVVKHEKLILRSYSDESSLLRFDEKNPNDNWAMSMTFDPPTLNSNEHGGIYLYYTNEKVELGENNGAFSKFNGWVIGLESRGRGYDIVFGYNNGESEWLSDIEDYFMKRDIIDPEKFIGHSNYTFKVIATKNNFKVELYGDDTLIYDNFKFTKQKDDLHKKGRYFGIIADYKNVPSSKAFFLTDVQLYKREENSLYNFSASHATPNVELSFKPKSEFKHHDDNVRELLYKSQIIEHLVKGGLGELPHTTLELLKEAITLEYKSLNEIFAKFEKMNQAIPTKIPANIPGKFNQLEQQTNVISRNLTELVYTFEKYTKKNQSDIYKYKLIIGVLGVITTGLLVNRIIILNK